MDLIRRPSSTLGLSTFEEMDKLFDNFWRSVGLPTSTFSLPSVDIYMPDDKHMVAEIPAPGFNAEDIEMNVHDNVLEIRGQKTEKEGQKDGKLTYLVRESNASFARRIVLPDGADTDKITAELDKGVLKVTVPVERPEAKRIKIARGKGSNTKKLTADNK